MRSRGRKTNASSEDHRTSLEVQSPINQNSTCMKSKMDPAETDSAGSTEETATEPLTADDKRKLIRSLIARSAEALRKDAGKPTMSDFIRLLALEKEYGEEKPSKITVEWIDPRTGKPWRPED